MQRTLALVVFSIAISIAMSLLVTTVVKVIPRLTAKAEPAEDVVEP